MVDFSALAARLLSQARSLLPVWFPAGRLQGHEFCVGDLAGSEGESLKININTGRWADFSSKEAGGDLISLYAAMHGMKQLEAAKALEGDGTILTRVPPAPEPQRVRGEWTPIPVPADAPPPPDEWYRREGSDWVVLKVRARWTYRDSAGNVVGHVCRFEWYVKDELHKDVVPQVYCVNADGKRQWRWRGMAEPRQLYNLPELLARPAAPVIIVEGEKKVEALRVLAPQYVGIAWAGGASAWRKTAWQALYGRKVLLWPDADQKTVKTEREAKKYGVAIGELIPRDLQPGILAMWEIGHHILPKCPEVKIILPQGVPDGWDAADAVAQGMDWQAFKAWALPLVQQLTGATDGQRSAGVSSQGSNGRGAADVRGAGGGEAGAAEAVAGEADGGDQAQARPGERELREGGGEDRAPHRGGAARGDRWSASGPRRDADGTRGAEPADARPAGGDHADRALPRTDAGEHDRNKLRASADPEKPAEAPSGQSQVARWLAWGLDRNGNGLPYTNLNNAVSVLESDPSLKGLMWYDEFLQRILTGDPAREWSDADDINLTLYMQRAVGLTKIGVDVVRNAVVVRAQRDTRNCVRDWMSSLVWDGTPRLEAFFSDVFGAEDNEYTRACGRNFWISIAARVFRPGCKVDNMIILEGSQGLGKSMALSIIGGEWFAEQHESATNSKAFAEVLQGKLIIEISEMDAFNRAEVNTIKKVVSCQSDRYRAAYGRHARDNPRQCVMIGTTNKDDWNRDETGARRSWPIRCEGLVRLDILRENRAQLFAEAVAAFKDGATWWEMPEERTKAEQRARFDADPWMQPIASYIFAEKETNTNSILLGCLKFEMQKIDRLAQMRVAACLRALGWKKKGDARRNGAVVKIWVRENEDEEVATFPKVATKGSDDEEPSPFQ